MTETFDNLFSGIDNTVDGKSTWVDADTIRDADDPNKKYRIQGMDAPETLKYLSTLDPEYPRRIKEGTAGGSATMEIIPKLARDHGFTIIHKTGEIGPHGREIVDLRNEKGESFATKLMSTGVLKSGAYTKEEDLNAIRVASLFGDRINDETTGEFKAAATELKAAMEKEGYNDLNFKKQALNEMQYASDPDKYNTNVQFRHTDRDILGNAKSPVSEAWDAGWLGVQESMWGALEMLGESTGSEMLNSIGEGGIARARTQQGELAKFNTDYKNIDSMGDFFQWAGNNAAMSLPYMVVTAGSALAAPVVGGVAGAVGGTVAGLTASTAVALSPAAMYAGQTWNEMEGERSAAVAVGAGVVQATLDRLGLAGLVKIGKVPTKTLNEAAEVLAVQRNISLPAAKEIVGRQSRKELALLMKDTKDIAAEQLRLGTIAKEALKKGGIGMASEGLTEVAQEATAYTAAVMGSDKKFNADEFVERIQQAAVAGSVLGGGFTVPGTAYNVGAWKNAQVGLQKAEESRLSDAGRYAEEEMKNNGYIPSIQEITAQNRASSLKPTAGFNERVDAHNRAEQGKDWKQKGTDLLSKLPALVQGTTRFIFQPDILAKSRTARMMADMFGGQLQRTFSGSNFESWKHHRVSIYKNMVSLPDKFWANMIGEDRGLFNRKTKREASKELYDTMRKAMDKDGNIDFSLIPDGPKKQAMIEFAHELQQLGDKMWQDQKNYNPDLGYINNYLLRYKAFDKRALEKNKNKFVNLLMSEYGMTRADANNIADNIINNDAVNDMAEAFSVTNGTPIPGSHRKRSLGLSENPLFEEFMEQDVFANISKAAKGAARFQAYNEFVGMNGEQLAKMLQQMQDEGVPPETVNKIAAQMKNYLDAESGNYKRPTTKFGKDLQKVQRNFMMITTFAGLPLATVSSLVELALTTKGLTQEQLSTQFRNMGKELANGLWEAMGKGGDFFQRKYEDRTDQRSVGREKLQDLGFYDWDVGAATTTGATEIAPAQQQFFDIYFKAIGLQQWTNYTRAVRAAIAGDYIFDKLDTIAAMDPDNKNNHEQEAEEALRNLGINVPQAVAFYQALGRGMELEPEMKEMMREAQYNFINEAVALPGSANRPLIYQDPRFAVFTQFQGFVATFTANHIPKLWGEYVKRGTPQMKYNAFAMMATMIMLGYASQELKDRLKYLGEENPHLSDAEKMQRAVRSSGLLGSYERVLDQFFPLYERGSKDAGEWIFNTTTGEAPTLSNIERMGKATGALLEGDVGKSVYHGLKATPVTGPFTAINKKIGDAASEWNFK